MQRITINPHMHTHMHIHILPPPPPHTHTHTHTIPRPSLASQKRVGFFVSDRSAQTEESDILEVKRITLVIETLIQVGGISSITFLTDFVEGVWLGRQTHHSLDLHILNQIGLLACHNYVIVVVLLSPV